jgi:hypothetical protein
VSFLRWFKKPTPIVLEVPDGEAKALKDWTDEDIEAAIWEQCKQAILWEPAARRGSVKLPSYDQLLEDAFQLRERERARCARSRYSVGFSTMRRWPKARWREWRHPTRAMAR